MPTLRRPAHMLPDLLELLGRDPRHGVVCSHAEQRRVRSLFGEAVRRIDHFLFACLQHPLHETASLEANFDLAAARFVPKLNSIGDLALHGLDVTRRELADLVLESGIVRRHEQHLDIDAARYGSPKRDEQLIS